MKQNQKVWLPCSVSEGMFPGERVSVVKTCDIDVSFFYSGDFSIIDDRGDYSFLKVQVLDSDDEFSLVLLPAESIECGRTVKVRSDQLRYDLDGGLL